MPLAVRKMAEESPVTAIDNPIVAAATLLSTSIVDPTLNPAQQELVKQEILTICNEEQAEEAMVYATWVGNQALDARKTTSVLCTKLQEWLNWQEQTDLVNMMIRLGKSKDIALNHQIAELIKRNLLSDHKD